MENTRYKTVDNILPEELHAGCNVVIGSRGWKFGWSSNPSKPSRHWNMDFTKANTLNGLEVYHELPTEIKEAWLHIRNTQLNGHRLVRCYANAHTYGTEGYKHEDGLRDGDTTVVVYMNSEDWNVDWGGETQVYENGETVLGSYPKKNRAIIFKSNMMHRATPVCRDYFGLRVTLMFKTTAPSAIDPIRDNIQKLLTELGTIRIRHQNGSLFQHLMRVYDRLYLKGLPAHVCAAGGAHSIFGTNVFKHVTTNDHERVSAVIGEDACRLVRLFSTTDRPKSIEEALEKGTEDQDTLHLAAIEAANLEDQKELSKFPHLLAYWNRLTKDKEV